MTWVKCDDMWPLHRKIRPLSDAAYRLHHSSVCFAARNMTNGHILKADLNQLADVRNPVKAMKELVAQGLWEETEIGWAIHDYLDYNPPADKLLAERDAARERQRRWRGEKKSRRDKGVSSPEVTDDVTREFANPVPVPVPVPVPPDSSLVDKPTGDLSVQPSTDLTSRSSALLAGYTAKQPLVSRFKAQAAIAHAIGDGGYTDAQVAAALARLAAAPLPITEETLLRELNPTASTKPSTTNGRVAAGLALAEQFRTLENSQKAIEQ